MLKKIRKEYSGFSLIELIVVVLIMAIIAVAMAPQIMKWVENSKKSADMQTKANMKAAMTVTIAGESVISELLTSNGAKLKVENSGAKLYMGNGTTEFDNSSVTFREFNHNLGETRFSDLKTKMPGTYILIEINAKPYITSAKYCNTEDDSEILELD